MERVRFGIVGIGNMGSEHARTVPTLPRAELAAIADIDPAKLARFADVPGFESADALLDSGLVDAVIVATPHYAHTTIGAEVMRRGLHLLTEKPISVHKADCERLISAWQGGAQKFAAMFQMRTDANYKAIRKVVASGELGEVRRTNWIVTDWFRSQAYYSSGGWRATWGGEGGGVLLNQCPHNLDLFQWICGMPSRVRAHMGFGKYHAIEVEDDVTAFFEYPNGGTGVFVTTTGEAPGTNRLEIVGDRGKLVYEGGKIVFWRTEESVRHFCDTTPDLFPSMPSWRCEVPAPGAGASHRTILLNFIDAILDGADLIAPAQEGIHSVELANAMLMSAWTGEAVDVPLDGARYESLLMEKIANSQFQKDNGPSAVADLSGSFGR